LIWIKFLLLPCLVMMLFFLLPIFLSTFIEVMKYMQVNNVRPKREVAMCSLFEDVWRLRYHLLSNFFHILEQIIFHLKLFALRNCHLLSNFFHFLEQITFHLKHFALRNWNRLPCTWNYQYMQCTCIVACYTC
jgi:hypothetical protein